MVGSESPLRPINSLDFQYRYLALVNFLYPTYFILSNLVDIVFTWHRICITIHCNIMKSIGNTFHQQIQLMRHRGFTLITTISLLVLLTMIAIGVLSLSSVTLRGSQQGNGQAQARANARLALQLALGDLQRHAGPDQRVTAAADMINASQNRQWLGVWKTTQTSGSNELPSTRWTTTRQDSSITDDRTNPAITQQSFFQRWMVSGNGTPSSPGSSLTRILGPGSVQATTDFVDVPLVTTQNGSTPGGYAYWVSDQSTKADAATGADSQNLAENNRLMQPPRTGISVLAGLENHQLLRDDEIRKFISHRQGELTASGSRTAWNQWRHSTTAASRSVLSDPIRGGLKKDLSVYLIQGSAPSNGPLYPAVTDNTPLLNSTLRSIQGPRLGSLRAWSMLADRSATAGVAPSAASELVAMGKFNRAPNFQRFQSHPIHPVMASVQLYTRFSYIRGFLAVHLFPRIILWNPYNVRLAAAEYTIDFNHAVNDSMDVERITANAGGAAGSRIISTAYDTRGAKENRMRLTIESTAFEPGEALVFSPKPNASAIAGRAMPLVQRSTTGQNVMSAQVSPRQLTNFYITLNALPGVSAQDLPIRADHNKGSYYWIDMMDWWEGNPDNGLKVSMHLGSANNYTSLLNLPLLQLVDTDNWKRGYEGRFNNGRWKVGGQEMVYNYETTSDFEPWARTNYGFRLKWWAEKNPSNLAGAGADRMWQGAVLADYNLRAPMSHHTPYDNITDNAESHHWYMWGPYAVEREQGLPYLSPELAAHSSANGFRANPFFGGASSRPTHVYPIYDLPLPAERVVSLGRFQHAQITAFLWHANYPIGGSLVPQNLKSRDRSADVNSALSSMWTTELPHLPAWMLQDRNSEPVIYDLAYEANYELWDRFFLSGANASEKTAFAANPAALLANRRLQSIGTAEPAVLNDYHRAASQLLLRGGFNVNCTDPAAWRALLSSLRGLSLGGSTGQSTPFPRNYNNTGAAYEPNSIYDPQVWTGMRRLSDAQITALATQIVAEVRRRGPFHSVADFVNRRLVRSTGVSSNVSASGLKGTLQAAIDNAGINTRFVRTELALTRTGHGRASYEPGSNLDAWADPTHMRDNAAIGLPTCLQQGDLLQPLGSLLVSRGDTFTIRAYGEARAADGVTVTARAWCEAEVQRMPYYVDRSNPPEMPPFTAAGAATTGFTPINRVFGRRFELVSFRWLNAGEI